MYDFNKPLKNGNAKHLPFPGTTSKQLLQYLDVSLKMCTPDIVLIRAGINDVFKNKSQSNTENLLSKIKYTFFFFINNPFLTLVPKIV